jgi:hypothetical protein
MLLCLAYLAVMNTLALLRLLPMSERDKDIEILALRHRRSSSCNARSANPRSPTRTAWCSPARSTACPGSGYANSCCSYGRTRSCAGIAT